MRVRNCPVKLRYQLRYQLLQFKKNLKWSDNRAGLYPVQFF